jgi:hypothetical protein
VSTLTVGFDGEFGGSWNAPMAAEIIGGDISVVERLVLRPGRPHEVSLQPGSYLVEARLPSGEALRQTVEVPEEGRAEVLLELPETRHEWLIWPTVLGSLSHAVTARPRRRLGDFGDVWLRTWERDPGEPVWTPGTWELHRSFDEDEHAALFFVPGGARTLRLVQVGAPRAPARFVAVPPSPGRVDVFLAAGEEERQLDAGLLVRVLTQNRTAEALLHYLSTGTLAPGMLLGEKLGGELDGELDQELMLDILDEPSAAFADMVEDQAAAAVALYFMLRTGASDRIAIRALNLADWFEFLPDGAVIRAWQLLHGDDAEARLGEVRDRLVQAADRGVPVYSDGLQLLLEGLELVAAYDEFADDAGVRRAHELARAYAAAADFSQALTTFLGMHPDKPSVRPSAGESGGDAGTVFLRPEAARAPGEAAPA